MGGEKRRERDAYPQEALVLLALAGVGAQDEPPESLAVHGPDNRVTDSLDCGSPGHRVQKGKLSKALSRLGLGHLLVINLQGKVRRDGETQISGKKEKLIRGDPHKNLKQSGIHDVVVVTLVTLLDNRLSLGHLLLLHGVDNVLISQMVDSPKRENGLFLESSTGCQNEEWIHTVLLLAIEGSEEEVVGDLLQDALPGLLGFLRVLNLALRGVQLVILHRLASNGFPPERLRFVLAISVQTGQGVEHRLGDSLL